MIHHFPEDTVFEEPGYFTDPFRYIPHPLVRLAAAEVIARIDSKQELREAFSEGKMLGVLVCSATSSERQHHTVTSSERQHHIVMSSERQHHIVMSSERQRVETSLCYIAAFSGNVAGRSIIDGFVPSIFDLTAPDGHFKKREAEISEINRQIEELLTSDRRECLESELAEARCRREKEIEAFKEQMVISKRMREEIRSSCTDPTILERLILESQHEKAEFRRLKQALNAVVDGLMEQIALFNNRIETLKKQRAAMSDELQDWIFRQYIVHNALGEKSSIAEIFADQGIVPPGGTGECAAPKLLEYAYCNGLTPIAMGEFWYGKSPQTAVRTHGHFYPSCTSKCGPLLGYMLGGMSISEWPMIPKTPAFASLRHPLAGGGMSSPSSVHSDVEQTVQPIQIPEPITLYEDEAMIVVEKPSGMPSVPGLDGRTSLLELLSATSSERSSPVTSSKRCSSVMSSERCSPVMSSERSESRHLHPVHRLDMDTSGIMLFAKTPEAAVHLRRQFEEHSVRKTYIARVSGAPSQSAEASGTTPPTSWVPPPAARGVARSQKPPQNGMGQSGHIELPLSADYDERPRQKVDFKQGKAAHTEYRIVSENPDGTADLLLYPHTGRTHQLRVHCAHTLGLGRPILGDLLYGAHCVKDNSYQAASRLCLHALSITFRHPVTSEPLTFTSEQFRY